MSGLKVYYDLMSQPSRAVVLFLKRNKIAFEAKAVALRKGKLCSNTCFATLLLWQCEYECLFYPALFIYALCIE